MQVTTRVADVRVDTREFVTIARLNTLNVDVALALG